MSRNTIDPRKDLFFAEFSNDSVVCITDDQLKQIKQLIDSRKTSKEIKSCRKIPGLGNQDRVINDLAADLTASARILSALVPEEVFDDKEKAIHHYELITHVIMTDILERSKLVLENLYWLLDYEGDSGSK